jgi:hypothetical protein
MFPSKSRSRTGTGRNRGWAGMSILTYQLGTVHRKIHWVMFLSKSRTRIGTGCKLK